MSYLHIQLIITQMYQPNVDELTSEAKKYIDTSIKQLLYNIHKKYGIKWNLSYLVNYMLSHEQMHIDEKTINTISYRLTHNPIHCYQQQNIILDTLVSNNGLGKVLNSEEYIQSRSILNSVVYKQILDNIEYMYQPKTQRDAQNLLMLELTTNKRYQRLSLNNTTFNKWIANCRSQIIQYLNNFQLTNSHLRCGMLTRVGIHRNLYKLMYHIKTFNGYKINHLKSQLVNGLINKLNTVNTQNLQDKYSILQSINYCSYLTSTSMRTQLNIQTQEDVDKFINNICLYDQTVFTLDQLEANVKFFKTVEFHKIDIEQTSNQNFDNVPIEIVRDLFYNCCGKLYNVLAIQPYTLIQNADTEEIIYNPWFENEFFDQFKDDYVYRLIGAVRLENYTFQRLKLEVIALFNLYIKRQINLMHPQYLKTLFALNIQITNMQQCINLENLALAMNIHNTNEFKGLTKIKRVFLWYITYIHLDENQEATYDALKYQESSNDEIYDPNKVLLSLLLRQCQLEYVYIIKGFGIVCDMCIQIPIPNLRFFYCYKEVKITFDVAACNPEKLELAYVMEGRAEFINGTCEQLL